MSLVILAILLRPITLGVFQSVKCLFCKESFYRENQPHSLCQSCVGFLSSLSV